MVLRIVHHTPWAQALHSLLKSAPVVLGTFNDCNNSMGTVLSTCYYGDQARENVWEPRNARTPSYKTTLAPFIKAISLVVEKE